MSEPAPGVGDKSPVLLATGEGRPSRERYRVVLFSWQLLYVAKIRGVPIGQYMAFYSQMPAIEASCGTLGWTSVSAAAASIHVEIAVALLGIGWDPSIDP